MADVAMADASSKSGAGALVPASSAGAAAAAAAAQKKVMTTKQLRDVFVPPDRRRRGFGVFEREDAAQAKRALEVSADARAHVDLALRKVEGLSLVYGRVESSKYVEGVENPDPTKSTKPRHEYLIRVTNIPSGAQRSMPATRGKFMAGVVPENNTLALVKRRHWDDVKAAYGLTQGMSATDKQWAPLDPATWEYVEITVGDVIKMSVYDTGYRLPYVPGTPVKVMDLTAQGYVIKPKPEHTPEERLAILSQGPRHRLKGFVIEVAALPDGLTYATILDNMTPGSRSVPHLMDELVRREIVALRGQTAPMGNLYTLLRFGCTEEEWAATFDRDDETEQNFVKLLNYDPANGKLVVQDKDKKNLCNYDTTGDGVHKLRDASFLFSAELCFTHATIVALFHVDDPLLWSTFVHAYLPALRFYAQCSFKVQQSTVHPLNARRLAKKLAVVARRHARDQLMREVMAAGSNPLAGEMAETEAAHDDDAEDEDDAAAAASVAAGDDVAVNTDIGINKIEFFATTRISQVFVSPAAFMAITIPVTRALLAERESAWIVSAAGYMPREKPPGNSFVKLLTPLLSKDARPQWDREDLEREGCLRVMIADTRFVPYLSRLSKMPPRLGAEFVRAVIWTDTKSLSGNVLPPAVNQPPYNVPVSLTGTMDPSKAKMLLYVFDPTAVRFTSATIDLSNYGNAGEIIVEHKAAPAPMAALPAPPVAVAVPIAPPSTPLPPTEPATAHESDAAAAAAVPSRVPPVKHQKISPHQHAQRKP